MTAWPTARCCHDEVGIKGERRLAFVISGMEGASFSVNITKRSMLCWAATWRGILMVSIWRETTIIAVAMAVLALSACNDTFLSQKPDQALIRTSDPKSATIKVPGPVASRLLPYALIAEQTYHDEIYQGYSRHKAARAVSLCASPCKEGTEAAEVLSNWHLIFAQDGHFDGLPGLGVQIWVTRGKVCREAVIAFRGSETSQYGNWVSNLHWFSRMFGIKDQYKQVQDHIAAFIRDIEDDPCYGGNKTTIVAVGHSLGAGLAQHANYADGRIKRIYEFDPTFVTGSLDPGLPNRDANARGLVIERVYEHGEILAFPRWVMRHLFLPATIDPCIILTRFNVIEGNVLRQHKIRTFDTKLLDTAYPDASSKGYAPETETEADGLCSDRQSG